MIDLPKDLTMPLAAIGPKPDPDESPSQPIEIPQEPPQPDPDQPSEDPMDDPDAWPESDPYEMPELPYDQAFGVLERVALNRILFAPRTRLQGQSLPRGAK